MTGLVQGLIAASILLSLAFVLTLGHPRGAVAWMLAGWAWTTAALETLLLLATFRVHVPAWAAVVVLLAQDAVFAWRIVLLWRSRRSPEERTNRSSHASMEE